MRRFNTQKIASYLLILLAGIVLALFAISLANSAEARENHSIPWFERNVAARHEALRLCRDDYRRVNDAQMGPICANAEAAEARAYARRQRESFEAMDAPAWWSRNPGMRSAALVACDRRSPADQHLLRYCKPARESAGIM